MPSRLKTAWSILLWRWGLNLDRTLRHTLDGGLDQRLKTDLTNFRSEGIIVRLAQEVFGETGFMLLDKIFALVGGKLIQVNPRLCRGTPKV